MLAVKLLIFYYTLKSGLHFMQRKIRLQCCLFLFYEGYFHHSIRGYYQFTSCFLFYQNKVILSFLIFPKNYAANFKHNELARRIKQLCVLGFERSYYNEIKISLLQVLFICKLVWFGPLINILLIRLISYETQIPSHF